MRPTGASDNVTSVSLIDVTMGIIVRDCHPRGVAHIQLDWRDGLITVRRYRHSANAGGGGTNDPEVVTDTAALPEVEEESDAGPV
jgi:hypothetical protein